MCVWRAQVLQMLLDRSQLLGLGLAKAASELGDTPLHFMAQMADETTFRPVPLASPPPACCLLLALACISSVALVCNGEHNCRFTMVPVHGFEGKNVVVCRGREKAGAMRLMRFCGGRTRTPRS